MIEVFYDAETHFDREYSLSKMPTAAYVRDPRFQCFGAAIAIPGVHGPKWYDEPQMRELLDALPWEKVKLIAHNCVPADTEVLTPNGWVSIAQISKGGTAMQWHPETEALAFAEVLATTKQTNQTVLQWSSIFNHMACTEGHRVYYKTPSKMPWRATTAAQVANMGLNNVYIPLSGLYDPATPFLSDDECRLMEAIRADGSFPVANSARFSLKKPRKIERLLTLLDRLQMPYVTAPRKGDPSVLIVRLHKNERLSAIHQVLGPKKKYTMRAVLQMPLRAKQVILEESMFWDGSDTHRTCKSFSWATACRETAEAFQLMAHTSGWRLSGRWVPNNRGYSKDAVGRTLFVATVKRSNRGKLQYAPERVEGVDVYCITVPSGAFLARRNGRVFVTGNCSFDGLILSERYGKYPALHHDTMHQARYAIAQGLLPPEQRTSLASLMPLVGMTKGDTEAAVAAGGEQLASYALDDITATMRLKEYMPALPDDEAAISDLHIRMAVEPRFHLDEELLRSIASEQPSEEAQALRSKAAFAAALRAAGVEPEMKRGKKGADYAFAKTDDFMKKLGQHPNPVVRLLVDLRLDGASSIERTRAQKFLDIGSPCPMPLLYYGAGSGRSSGVEINPQNLPARGGVPRLRKSLIAPPGHKIVVVDSSQIEVRVMTWRAKDRRTQALFDSGQDVYTALAAQMYHKPASECGKESRERQIAKSARLALQFAQGRDGFQTYCARSNLYISAMEADQAVVQFRALNPEVTQLWSVLETEARRDKGLQLPSGRRIVYSGLRNSANGMCWTPPAIFRKSPAPAEENIWKGTFANNWVQGTARDLVMQQTVRWDRVLRSLGGAVVLSVHDEAVGIVPDEAVQEAEASALEAFAWLPAWAEGLTVKGEVKSGINYGVKG